MWIIDLSVGLLIGLALSNATIRHHVLTVLIWIFKATRWTMSQFIKLCEYLQDRFDNIEYVPQRKQQAQKNKPQYRPTQPTKQPEKSPVLAPDLINMSDEDINKWISENPEKITVKPKGGE